MSVFTSAIGTSLYVYFVFAAPGIWIQLCKFSDIRAGKFTMSSGIVNDLLQPFVLRFQRKNNPGIDTLFFIGSRSIPWLLVVSSVVVRKDCSTESSQILLFGFVCFFRGSLKYGDSIWNARCMLKDYRGRSSGDGILTFWCESISFLRIVSIYSRWTWTNAADTVQSKVAHMNLEIYRSLEASSAHTRSGDIDGMGVIDNMETWL